MKKIHLLSLVLSLAIFVNANSLVNGDFKVPLGGVSSGWTTYAGVTRVPIGLTSSTTMSALLTGGNGSAVGTGNLRQNIADPGTEFNLEFSFACQAPYNNSGRSFQFRLNDSQFTVIVNQSGAIQIYNGSSWVTVGTGTPITFSTPGSTGSLLDTDAIIKAYRMRFVFRNWGTTNVNYDIYLSSANSSNLTLFASNLTYVQQALKALSEVAFVSNYSANQKSYLLGACKVVKPGSVEFEQTNGKTIVSEKNQTSDTINVNLTTPPTQEVTLNISEKDNSYLTLNTNQLVFTPSNYDIPQRLIVTAKDDAVNQNGRYSGVIGFQTVSSDPLYDAKSISDIVVTINDDESVYQYPKYSGIYPHLATTNSDGECGMGAVVPWQGDLWYITYSDHYPNGSDDKLYQLSPDLTVTARPESVGGTPANRMIHKESNQLIIGSHFVDANKNVRTISPSIMPGRMTANSRHLTDPANRVYFITMEEGIYDVNVHDLTFTTLHPDVNTAGTTRMVPGAHMKGGYVGQNRFMIANNGNGGVLSEWKGSADGDPALSTSWTTVDRNKYTEITTKGGIYGATSQDDPVWSLGWDAKSVLLSVCDNGGVWKRYRLPKSSYTHDADHGWYTEWPRIRDVGYNDGNYLMDMHGLFYKFPSNFSNTHTGGIRPFSGFLKMIVDFADWNGNLVLSCDDATKFSNGICPRDQSNLIFTTREKLEDFGGKPYAFGGVWIKEAVEAGVPSEAMLINGFEKRDIHLAQNAGKDVNFTLQVDIKGDNQWTDLATVTVPASGYANYLLPVNLNAQWLRIVSDTKVSSASAYFYMSNPYCTQIPAMLSSVPDIQQKTGISLGAIRPMAGADLKLEFAADVVDNAGNVTKSYYQLDGDMNFLPATNTAAETTLRTTYAPTKDFTVDNASVIMTSGGAQYRLPMGDAGFDNPTVGGYPRGIREVVTERSLMNIHGTFYELPRDDAGGFKKIRPITTHNKQIYDFCSWRGMLVLSGNFTDAPKDSHYIRTSDNKAGLWLGNVDDLFKMGIPKGVGSTWKNASVTANTPSLPYLMQGYAEKSVVLSHNSTQPVTFTFEVDYLADGTFVPAFKVTVQPNETKTFTFPDGFNAQWVRTKVDVSCQATATFYYNMNPGGGDTKVVNTTTPDLLVFPNPVKNVLNIQGLTSPAKADVYSIHGVKVWSGIVNNKLTMSSFPNGAYTIDIANQKPFVVMKR